VLVALAIQQWNEDRLEKIEETEILDRLLIDLDVDLRNLELQISATTAKEESLKRLEPVLASGQFPADASEFLNDVVIGANYGWNQMSPRSRTFEEILSSGKFGLIRDADLRNAISGYYGTFNASLARADARETEYPHISYRLIPRSRESDREGALLDAELAGVDNESIKKTVDAVLNSEIGDYVIAERNLALFLLRTTADVMEQHQALVIQIQGYRQSLEN
jgi:hypothetical protein